MYIHIYIHTYLCHILTYVHTYTYAKHLFVFDLKIAQIGAKQRAPIKKESTLF